MLMAVMPKMADPAASPQSGPAASAAGMTGDRRAVAASTAATYPTATVWNGATKNATIAAIAVIIQAMAGSACGHLACTPRGPARTVNIRIAQMRARPPASCSQLKWPDPTTLFTLERRSRPTSQMPTAHSAASVEIRTSRAARLSPTGRTGRVGGRPRAAPASR